MNNFFQNVSQPIYFQLCILRFWDKTKILEHTEKKYDKDVPVKEKLLSDQSLLSSHFALKRKPDDNNVGRESSEAKNTRKEPKEPMIEEEDKKAEVDIKKLMVKFWFLWQKTV